MPELDRILIRSATALDAGALARMSAALARDTGEAGGGIPEAEVVRLIEAERQIHLTVAEWNGQVAGYALHHVAYESAYGAKGRYLADIYVEPAMRRGGVATMLAARVAAETLAEGGEFLGWLQKAPSEASTELYRHLADVSVPVMAFASTRQAFQRLARQDRGGVWQK